MADLAVYLIRSGAFLALFYAFYWLVLRRETFFALNRAYLLGGAGLALVLPLLRVTSPFFETVVSASAPAPLAFDPGPVAAGPRALEWAEVLALVYAAGAAFFLLLFLVRLARLVVLVGRCGCVRHHGLKVVLCGHPGESFSFFRFVFLNRSRVPEADLDRVLTHELAHVRQLHSLDIVFAEIVSVIQWFNPFVWPYKGSLRETHEYLADRAVIAQGCGRARYQLLIVEQHVGGRLLELASSFRTSQIKRRIDMLSKQDTRGLARWKPLLALPLVLVLILAFAESRTVVKADPGAAAVQSGPEKVKKDGPPPQMTDEEKLKALQEKSLQLKEMKQKNEQMLAKLKEQLGATSDKAEQEKIQAEIRAQKAMSLEIEAKGCLLAAKKAELALAGETDAAKRADLQKKMEELQAKAKDLALKAETVRNAELGVEKTAEKK